MGQNDYYYYGTILNLSSLSHNPLMYEDYCLDMEETIFCFEISNSRSTII